MRYNRDTRQIKARRGVVATPHTSMREQALPHNSVCCTSPHYIGKADFLQVVLLGFVSG